MCTSWIFNFLTGRTHSVSVGGCFSDWRPITASIVQGSGIGPSLFILYTMNLKPLSMWQYSPSVSETTSWSHAASASAFRPHGQSRPCTAIDRCIRSTQSPSVAIFSVRDCTTPQSLMSTNTPSCSTLK